MSKEKKPEYSEKIPEKRNRKAIIFFMTAAALLFTYDLANTWHLVKWQLSTGNRTAMESTWTHFAARNIGALIGVSIALLLRRIVLSLRKRQRSQR